MRCLRNILVAVLAFAPAAFSQSPCNVAISTGSLPSGTVGQPYSATVSTSMTGETDGTPIISWSNSGLPPGLSMGTTGASVNIAGTPTMGGNFPFFVSIAVGGRGVNCTVSNSPAQLSIAIAVVPAITTQSPLPNAEVGFPYSTTFTAVNGGGTYQWSTSTPPAGLTLSSGGVLSGTPTSAGTSAISVNATVPNAQPPVSLSGTFSLTVASALSIVTGSPLPSGVVGTPYSATISVIGGFPQTGGSGTGYNIQLTAAPGGGPPPPGLIFNAGS